MISVNGAVKIISDNLPDFGEQELPLLETHGLILKEIIHADRDYPPFDKSLMDGIAINHVSYESGNKLFSIEGIQAAGEPAKKLNKGDHCFEIMTGAVLPQGCDCVIPIENVAMEDDVAVIKDGFDVFSMQNVRGQGADHKAGDILLHKGVKMSSLQIAICASVGKSKVMVCQRPKVAVVSSGDELVEFDKTDIEQYQTG